MKFTTKKNEIVDVLQMGASIAERRQTIPILANLRIVAKEGKIEITATDLEIQIRTTTEVTKIIEEGEITVSCLLYTSPSPRDLSTSRMPSSA